MFKLFITLVLLAEGSLIYAVYDEVGALDRHRVSLIERINDVARRVDKLRAKINELKQRGAGVSKRLDDLKAIVGGKEQIEWYYDLSKCYKYRARPSDCDKTVKAGGR